MKKYKFVFSIILISALVLNMIPVDVYECPEPDDCSLEKPICCENQTKEMSCCCVDKSSEKPTKETTNRATPPAENNVKNILFFNSDIYEQAIVNQTITYRIYNYRLLPASLTSNKVYKNTHTFLI